MIQFRFENYYKSLINQEFQRIQRERMFEDETGRKLTIKPKLLIAAD